MVELPDGHSLNQMVKVHITNNEIHQLNFLLIQRKTSPLGVSAQKAQYESHHKETLETFKGLA